MKKFLILTSLLPPSFLLGAVTSSWTFNGSGNWSVSTNWNNGVPNAPDDVAIFGNVVLAASSTITQDVAPTVTVGSLVLSSTNALGYTLTPAATNTITLSSSTGSTLINVPVTNVALQTIATPMILSSNLSITQNSANTLILSGALSGPFGMTSSGSGLVVLSGANTFTGGLTITAGTLQCGVAAALVPTGTVTLSGGTLDLNSHAQTIGGLTGSSAITLGNATLTINTSGANSYSGAITGTGGITVSGTGSLILTNTTSNYTLTTLTGGTVQLGATNALAAGKDVTISGGTLDLNNFNQSVGNLSGTGGSITLGTGQLSILLSQAENFSGVITGQGPVSFNGGGFIWTLGAAQSYTGLTTIHNGTIQLGVSNALTTGGAVALTATGVINLNNFSQTLGTVSASAGAQITLGSGSLTVAATAPASFAGVMSGSGSVTYTGPFIWAIQVVQTYTGGTVVGPGTLQMGVANALASTGAVTVNHPGVLSLNHHPLAIASLSGNGSVDLGDAALTLNTTAGTLFSGSIVGAGGQLIVQGSGTQVLAGINSYSGGTTVSPTATLQGDTNSLQGSIANSGLVVFSQPFDGIYAGTLSGGGALRLSGGGTVTLTGTSTQADVAVLAGELDLAAGSTLTATAISVSPGATLGGSGTFVANISNAGTINPGSEIPDGQLQVDGNVTFQTGSALIVDLTPIVSDQLRVNGIVTIDPQATLVANASRGEYEESTQYVVVTSTSPIVGQFQSVSQTNPFLVTQVFYNQVLPGSVILDLEIRSLSDVIQGGNAGAIARCITQANMLRDHDLEQIISEIIFASVDQVRKTLDKMQPSQLRALTVAEEINTLLAQQILNSRMAEFDKSICEKEISSCFPWNFWVDLAGSWSDQRNADHNTGYKAPAVGFEAGFDGKVADNVFLGTAVEYGHAELEWGESGGSATIHRMSAGPYLSYIGTLGYVNASLLASFAHFDAQRLISFVDRTASSHHFGQTLLSHLEGGIVLHPASHVSLIPFTMFDFIYGWEEGYKETGADSLNFTISSSTSSMLRSEVGLKISKCAVHSHTKWVHDIKASWVRENRFHGKELTATFRQFPCSFVVEGLYPSRNLLDLGMGLTFIFKQDRLAATLRYEGQFGQGVTLQNGIAQLLTRF